MGDESQLQGEVGESLRRPVSPSSDLTHAYLRADAARTAPARGRGTMLWFNADNDAGVLRTDDGERIEVPGTVFSPGEKPVGRCAGREIEFESLDGEVRAVSFVTEPNRRRARLRRRG